MKKASKSTLFYTCVNQAYEDFVPLYTLSVLTHVEGSALEIGVEDVAKFSDRYGKSLAVIQSYFGPDKLYVREVGWTLANGRRIVPNTVRFITVPHCKADYIYIADIDVIILDRDFVAKHLQNMEVLGLPYSNSVRAAGSAPRGRRRMFGRHFAPMEAHYPIPSTDDIDLSSWNDEAVLYEILKRKGFSFRYDHQYAPTHGIHMSPNRSPVGSVNSAGRRLPGWDIRRNARAWKEFSQSKAYQELFDTLSPRIRNCLLMIDAVLDGTFSIEPTGQLGHL